MARTPTYTYFGPKKLGLTQAQDWHTFAPKNTAYDLLRRDMIAGGKWTEQSHPTLAQQYQNLGLDQLTNTEINELHPNVPLDMVPATHQISQVLEKETLAQQGLQPGTTFANRTPLEVLNVQRSGVTDNGLFVAQAQPDQNQAEPSESKNFNRKAKQLIDDFVNRNFSHIGHVAQIRFAARKILVQAERNFRTWNQMDSDYANSAIAGFVYHDKAKGYAAHMGKVNTNPADGIAAWGGGAGGNALSPPSNVLAMVTYHPVLAHGNTGMPQVDHYTWQRAVDQAKASTAIHYRTIGTKVPNIVLYQAFTKRRPDHGGVTYKKKVTQRDQMAYDLFNSK